MSDFRDLHSMKRPVVARRTFMSRALAAVSSIPLLGLAASKADAQTSRAAKPGEDGFSFGIMGDMPYTTKQEAEYARLIEDLNARNLAFVTHVGDMMFDPRPFERNVAPARQPNTDENYDYVLGTFQTIKHPVVLTPGDNDWSDAVEFKKQTVDPLASLAKLRSKFYPEGKSLGQRTMTVESQKSDPVHGEYIENLTWEINGVRFVTLHIMGSSDNAGRTPELDAEYKRRKAANIAWLNKAIDRAKSDDALGLVIITHANPGFENYWPAGYLARYFRMFPGMKPPSPRPASPFDDYIAALVAAMETYSRPTILFHGDTHLFRIDKPLFSDKTKRPFENFTRVETFGWPDTHWVRVVVDPSTPQLFEVEAQMVPGNRLNHI